MQSSRETGIREKDQMKTLGASMKGENKGTILDHKLGEGRKIVLSSPKCCEWKATL